ncbi:MAG: hypothetical protein WBW27_20765, partial [Pseudolabrys sp.]
GWIDGRNVRIDYRWSGRNAEDARKYATELVTVFVEIGCLAALNDWLRRTIEKNSVGGVS